MQKLLKIIKMFLHYIHTFALYLYVKPTKSTKILITKSIRIYLENQISSICEWIIQTGFVNWINQFTENIRLKRMIC